MDITATGGVFQALDNVTIAPDLPLEGSPFYQASRLVSKIYSPIVIVLGTFGNVMSIIIMSRMTSGDSSVNIFFMAIAVGDLIVIYSGIMTAWVEDILNVNLEESSPQLNFVRVFFVSCSGAIVSWLLACVTMQRAMSVTWPHRVSHVLTTEKVKLAIGCVTLIQVGVYSHFLYAAVDNDVQPAYFNFLQQVFTFVDVSMFTAIPSACLIAGNAVLISALVTSVKKARDMAGSVQTSEQDLKRQKTAMSVTLTVLVVSAIFILLTLPSCIYLILFEFQDPAAMTSQEKDTSFFFQTVTFLLADSNSAVNFYLYCLTGRRFRQEFVKILCRR